MARFGDMDAENLFITCSGTHGNEGLCGSGCQIGFIKERIINARPKSVAGCWCMPSIPTAFPMSAA